MFDFADFASKNVTKFELCLILFPDVINASIGYSKTAGQTVVLFVD